MSDEAIDVTGIDHGALLAALHNGTRPLGMGQLHARGNMTPEEGRKFLENGATVRRCGGMEWSVDYVYGRPIKVGVKENQLYGARLYDRDAGEGRCAQIVEQLLDEATRPSR